jgi:hypothetical protein
VYLSLLFAEQCLFCSAIKQGNCNLYNDTGHERVFFIIEI